MQKKDIFKFSLTAICVAVLSACGSSGGGSPTITTDTTTTTPTNNTGSNTSTDAAAAELAAAKAAQAAAEKAAAEAAAAQAAAEQAAADAAAKAAEDAAKAAEAAKAAQDEAVKKAAAEAAKQALAEKEAADKAAAEAKAAAEKAAAEAAAAEAAAKAADAATNPFGAKDILTTEPDTAQSVSFVGAKQTVKVKSNLATNTSTATDSQSDIPTPMRVQKPHASLDTIVVAEPKDDAGAARVYLEDFDTRSLSTHEFNGTPSGTGGINKTKKDAAVAKGITGHGDFGNTALTHIYINEHTADKAYDAKAAERAAVVKAAADAQKAAAKTASEVTKQEADLAAAKQRVTDLKAALTAVTSNAATTVNPSTGATGVENAEIKQQAITVALQAATKKVSELEAAVNVAKQKNDEAQAAYIAATAASVQFEIDNPTPAATNAHATRTPETGSNYAETKTDKMGTKVGAIWNFSQTDIDKKRQNFTEYSTKIKDGKNTVKNAFIYKGVDLNGDILVTGQKVNELGSTDDTTDSTTKVAARNLDETVAEIYGYRSKAFGGSQNAGVFTGTAPQPIKGYEKPFDIVDNIVEPADGDTPANNLPLVNEYNGAKLYNVQYGRVTTALHGQAATEEYLKKGVQLDGSTATYVASFGEYDNDKTENHYFYRGINNVGADELKVLKNDTKNGTIIYAGHAVTYGLNHNYRGDVPIPTAVGARAGFVSGTHAGLKVNLANNEVTGSIHNKWYDSVNSPTELRNVKLVDLKGVIADNGNIAGTATRMDNNTSGVFGATLFGKGAEVGGSFASDDHKDGKWGGVFGGIRLPDTPEAAKEAGMAVGTDKKN